METTVLLRYLQIPLTHIWIVTSVFPPLMQLNVVSSSGRLLLCEFRFIGLKNSIPGKDHLNILKLPPSSGSHNSNTSILSTPTKYVYLAPVTATRQINIPLLLYDHS